MNMYIIVCLLHGEAYSVKVTHTLCNKTHVVVTFPDV